MDHKRAEKNKNKEKRHQFSELCCQTPPQLLNMKHLLLSGVPGPQGLGGGSRVWPSSTDGSGRALGATASPGHPEQGAGPVAQSRACFMKPGLLNEAGTSS
ncbi:unnamed protein product [Gadus morhua 'NCC']